MLFGYPALKNDFYNMFELQIHLIHSSTIDCLLCLNQHFSKGQVFFGKVKKGAVLICDSLFRSKRVTGLRASSSRVLAFLEFCSHEYIFEGRFLENVV